MKTAISLLVLIALISTPRLSRAQIARETGKITLTDSRGRRVEIKRPIRKIAYNHVSIAEALKILNCWEMVVARDHHTTDTIVFPNLADIPIVTQQTGGPYNLNYEKVIQTEPDLFLAADISMDGFDDMVSKLGPNIPVFVVELNRISTLEENFKRLGSLLGKEKESQEFLDWKRQLTAMIMDKTGTLPAEKKRVTFSKQDGANLTRS